MGKQISLAVLSFLASLVAWGFIYGNFLAATVLMVVILIHELGHYFAGVIVGTKVQLPMFVLIGAFVAYEQPKRTRDRFFIAMAGPLLGAIAAGAMWYLGVHMRDPLLIGAAKLGLLLNAFNLIPVPMLDGGHAALVIDRRLWKVGIAMIFAYAGYQMFHNNFTPLIFIVFFWDQVKNYMKAIEAQFKADPDAWKVTPGERGTFAAVYFGLSAVLAYACYSIGLFF